jgi:hypothetical protein
MAVSSWPRLEAAGDPLGADRWFRVQLTTNTSGEVSCRIHNPDKSPYNDYFTGTFAEDLL